MRANVVFFVLLALLGVLGISVAMRPKENHGVTVTVPSASSEPAGAPSASASAAPLAASAVASAGVDAGAKPAPGLGRTLRVTALGWDLAAPAVLANGGLEPKKDSALGKAGLEVAISVSDDGEAVERALARGGADEAGADVAIVPLPTLIASWEHLSALDPAVFQVTAWSRGRDVVAGKQPFDKLPASGDVHVAGDTDAPATALALLCLDLAGVAPGRIKLVDRGDGKAELSARARSAQKPGDQASVLLTSADASHFIPMVAVASAGLLKKHPEVFSSFEKAWLGAAKDLATDAASAARTIASIKDAPEPVELMARLGELGPVGLAENAELLGLSGRSAVSIESLFQRTWRMERDAKLLLAPPPEHAPIVPSVVAALVRANPDASRSEVEKSAAPKGKAPSTARPILVAHVAGSAFDGESASAELGFVAGVFARSALRVSAYRGGAPDKAAAAELVRETADRFGVAEGRLISAALPGRPGVVASFEILPVP